MKNEILELLITEWKIRYSRHVVVEREKFLDAVNVCIQELEASMKIFGDSKDESNTL